MGPNGVPRATGWIVFACVAIAASAACTSDPGPSGGPFTACPEGYTEWSATDEAHGPPVPLEEALRARLGEVPVRVAPEAVEEALERARSVVISSIGTEAFDVEAVDGTTVTILLDHTDGGFFAQGARWCAPTS